MNPKTPNSIIIITPPPVKSTIIVTYDDSLSPEEVLESLQQIIDQLKDNPVG